MMKFQSLGTFSGVIQHVVICDSAEQLHSPSKATSNTPAYVLCHHLQYLEVLAHVDKDNWVPMVDASLELVK